MKVNQDWWKNAFGKNIFPLAAMTKSFHKITPVQVKFIIQKVGLRKGAQVLDLCCGVGRHSIVLAKSGMNVTGLDFSKPYLALARKAAGRSPIRWIQGDMRKLKFKNEFDCVINMWSSFGYFSPADNKRTVKGIYKSLKPGGYFFIDSVNGDFLKKNFLKKQWLRLPDGTFEMEEGFLDSKNLRVKTQWYFLKPDKKLQQMQSKIELYNFQKMSLLLKQAGFKKIKFYSGFAGEKFKKDSYRLIAIAQK